MIFNAYLLRNGNNTFIMLGLNQCMYRFSVDYTASVPKMSLRLFQTINDQFNIVYKFFDLIFKKRGLKRSFFYFKPYKIVLII